MSDFKLPVIKTKDDLSMLFKYLSDQGFGYFSDYEYHNKKVDSIINKANKMNISFDSKLKNNLSKINDYGMIKKEAEMFFSKFTPDDKIFELLDIFYLQNDADVRSPYHSPSAKDVIEWVEFRKKYELKDEFQHGSYVSYYNLDKNYLKIHFPEYKDYYFRQLYEYIFNEKTLEYDEKKAGEWLNLGKIEIKFFLKGGAQIKGDIQKLKDYYYKHLNKKHYASGNDIIKYNNKVIKLIATERL